MMQEEIELIIAKRIN